ncbi:hypothetical protein TNCV_4679651 [Trichonephila clavipes]|nr:hypothetical protein TNCV_4679651 [Trichonephila clavipes]
MLFQDQKRMVLQPEEVGEKGFLESHFPTFRIDSSGKDMRRTGFEGPDWRQKAKTRSALGQKNHTILEEINEQIPDTPRGSAHKKKYIDRTLVLKQECHPGKRHFCHKKKYLDYPGLETSATPANDNSCHKKSI